MPLNNVAATLSKAVAQAQSTSEAMQNDGSAWLYDKFNLRTQHCLSLFHWSVRDEHAEGGRMEPPELTTENQNKVEATLAASKALLAVAILLYATDRQLFWELLESNTDSPNIGRISNVIAKIRDISRDDHIFDGAMDCLAQFDKAFAKKRAKLYEEEPHDHQKVCNNMHAEDLDAQQELLDIRAYIIYSLCVNAHDEYAHASTMRALLGLNGNEWLLAAYNMLTGDKITERSLEVDIEQRLFVGALRAASSSDEQSSESSSDEQSDASADEYVAGSTQLAEIAGDLLCSMAGEARNPVDGSWPREVISGVKQATIDIDRPADKILAAAAWYCGSIPAAGWRTTKLLEMRLALAEDIVQSLAVNNPQGLKDWLEMVAPNIERVIAKDSNPQRVYDIIVTGTWNARATDFKQFMMSIQLGEIRVLSMCDNNCPRTKHCVAVGKIMDIENQPRYMILDPSRGMLMSSELGLLGDFFSKIEHAYSCSKERCYSEPILGLELNQKYNQLAGNLRSDAKTRDGKDHPSKERHAALYKLEAAACLSSGAQVQQYNEALNKFINAENNSAAATRKRTAAVAAQANEVNHAPPSTTLSAQDSSASKISREQL